MTETLSPRLSLQRWSAGTDTPQRVEFDTSFGNIDTLAAIYKQGTFAARPAAGVVGTFYHDTTNVSQWYDTGSAWVSVGAKPFDAVPTASGPGTVPLTALGAASQTADLFQAKVGSTVFYKIGASGDVTANNGFNAQYASLINTVNGQVPLFVKGASGQTADLAQIQTSAGTNRWRLSPTGVISSTYFVTGDSQGVIGNSSASVVANMTKFAGTPMWEMYSQNGGASGTFTDFAYLHHLAADATVTTRRLGLLMKIGAETVGDAPKSGGLYIESTAANAANVKLALMRADTDVMVFPATGDVNIVNNNLTVDQKITSNKTSGDAAYAIGSLAAFGAQGTNAYVRTGSSSSIYYYSGGVHSDTPGNAGTGGVVLAQLLRTGSVGQYIVDRARITKGFVTIPNPPDSSTAFIVGASNDWQMHITGDSIQATDATNAPAELFLNRYGPYVVAPPIYGSNSGFQDDWHSFSIGAGWAAGVGGVSPKYRYVSSPPQAVEFIGNVSGGDSSQNVVLGTLPAGYRPNSLTQRHPIYAFGAGMNIGNETPAIDVNTSGQVILKGCGNAAQFIAWHFFISLDI